MEMQCDLPKLTQLTRNRPSFQTQAARPQYPCRGQHLWTPIPPGRRGLRLVEGRALAWAESQISAANE